jgi:hypothetical protein
MGVFADAIGGSRFVVVVRRDDESTYEYLKTRLGRVRGVEVMLDRRQDPDGTATVDRRRASARFNSFGVLLARR